MLRPKAAVVSVEMGYGHLRAALPLVDAFECELLSADGPPLADAEEQTTWSRVRRVHELLSRPSQLSALMIGEPRRWMDRLTNIPPLHTQIDLSKPNLGTTALKKLIERGLGRGLIHYLQSTGVPHVTTFYAPAIIADHAGYQPNYCVATDADINRVWAPADSANTKIHYFAPSARAKRRLQAYGVPPANVTLTGFPLPVELLGGRDLSGLRGDLARRLVRLDPRGTFRSIHGDDLERVLGPLPTHSDQPLHLVFAVGGAGAQAEMASEFLPSLRSHITSGRLRVTLVAGTRPDVAKTFERAILRAGLVPGEDPVQVLLKDTFLDYYRAFNALLRDTDVLWTKPSELSFYAALGLALVLAKPVGSHERFNRRWLREQGVALKQDSTKHVAHWLDEWLDDGTLAAAAWTGFMRLPKEGTYRIVDHVLGNRPASLGAALQNRSATTSSPVLSSPSGVSTEPAPILK